MSTKYKAFKEKETSIGVDDHTVRSFYGTQGDRSGLYVDCMGEWVTPTKAKQLAKTLMAHAARIERYKEKIRAND